MRVGRCGPLATAVRDHRGAVLRRDIPALELQAVTRLERDVLVGSAEVGLRHDRAADVRVPVRHHDRQHETGEHQRAGDADQRPARDSVAGGARPVAANARASPPRGRSAAARQGCKEPRVVVTRRTDLTRVVPALGSRGDARRRRARWRSIALTPARQLGYAHAASASTASGTSPLTRWSPAEVPAFGWTKESSTTWTAITPTATRNRSCSRLVVAVGHLVDQVGASRGHRPASSWARAMFATPSWLSCSSKSGVGSGQQRTVRQDVASTHARATRRPGGARARCRRRRSSPSRLTDAARDEHVRTLDGVGLEDDRADQLRPRGHVEPVAADHDHVGLLAGSEAAGPRPEPHRLGAVDRGPARCASRTVRSSFCGIAPAALIGSLSMQRWKCQAEPHLREHVARVQRDDVAAERRLDPARDALPEHRVAHAHA